MNLLILAGHSGPEAVGESWSAYQWILRLSRRHSVTLLQMCPPEAAEALRRAYPEARVVPFKGWPSAGPTSLNWQVKPGYLGFYLSARKWIRRALRQGEPYDLAHQLNPLALRYPSPAAGLGLPLVVGPVGGSLATPPEFASEFGAAAWYTKLRSLDTWRLRHDPILRRTYESAGAVIGTAPYVREILEDLRIRRFLVMPEAGVTELPCQPKRGSPGDPLRLLFVGRIVRNKGVRDGIRAFGHLDVEAHLDVVGEGEDRGACEALVKELGLEDRVTFHGHVPRSRVDAFYTDADAFLFPSFREPSGGVVFEALSFGLPLITADRGGPGYSVDETCGLKVPVTTPAEFARGLADAIHTLHRDRPLLERLSTGARARAERERFDTKIEWVDAVYREVVAG